MTEELSPIPAQGVGGPKALAELREARAQALEATAVVQELERQTRAARRTASQRGKMYERLLLEYSGQQTLDFDH